ncbi:heterokaryon incompatibility protein [Colletotrichum gloeosporioides Cg-14]|uniref:Heterokaryon incompatibility protein n=1 Tax=Colletotrichum gloeosporioides (strain Cg-14) TaxID=1237896 RepID=T0LWF0_COLGC|nr:heterokaryon incompatibility protein [Colletotrichum gloeosporioides Cg-14]
MASIPYTDLDPEKREIRLLEVVCEPANTQFSYRLHTVSSDDNPYFIALSYVWGDHLVTEKINVDGFETPVTVNLATALRNVKKHWLDIQSERNTGRDAVQFRIWADAICINQQNLPEKSEQVPLMKDIYSNADFVFAWLSSEDGEISTSLEMLETAFYLVKILVHINFGRQLDITDDEWAETTHTLNHSVNWAEMVPLVLTRFGYPSREEREIFPASSCWTALKKLADLSYWSRVWILQELMLPKSLYFACPSRFLDHSKAIMAVTGIMEVLGAIQRGQTRDAGALGRSRASIIRSQLFLVQWRLNLRQAFHLQGYEDSCLYHVLSSTLFGTIRATDPRDYVYGVLAITKLDITPDYRDSIRKVYLDYARNLAFRDVAELRQASEVRISDASLWVAGVKAQKITYQYHKPLGADFWTKDLLDCFETLLAGRKSTYITGKPLVDVICCTLLQRLYSEYDLRRIASLFLYFYKWVPSGKIGEELRQAMEGLDEMEMTDNMEAMLAEWTTIMSENTGCRLVGTDDYIGIAGGDVQNDDIVCVLKDCDSPVILRPEGDHFLFVTSCFMLGLMKGEVSEILRS